MDKNIITVTSAYIIDDDQGLSLDQLCHTCGLSEDAALELIDEGILKVQGQRQRWRFSSENIRRARVALRLKRDLEINTAGIAVAIELLENLDELRRKLRILEARHPVSDD